MELKRGKKLNILPWEGNERAPSRQNAIKRIDPHRSTARPVNERTRAHSREQVAKCGRHTIGQKCPTPPKRMFFAGALFWHEPWPIVSLL
ncbi:hypothetical protein T10_7292 [Trichinella papuae]|uniref:Uncharacterized protein n=1 Tax=Trichinella papuae TaxID=268474 RepID=A0A0V1MBL3_9BILA|nr:hypothetical protein T10_7292 [Trichinella papuae]